MLAALDITGNPSSVHSAGRAARRLVEAAREQVAALVGAHPRDVVFTSGGTEANMLALTPALGETLLVSAIEHPSARSGGRFARSRKFRSRRRASSILRRWNAGSPAARARWSRSCLRTTKPA